MAKKKKNEDEKEPPLKEPILKTTGARKIIDAFRGTPKAPETSKPLEIETMNMKRPMTEAEKAVAMRKRQAEEDKKRKARGNR